MAKKTIYICAAVGIYLALVLLDAGGLLGRQVRGLLTPIGINIILAVSLNLTVGYLGELTLGHAGFMAVGAYTGCLFAAASTLPQPVTLILSLAVGGCASALAGIIIGIPVLRLRGDYLAIVTLAFGEVIRSVINALPITGGAGGLRGFERFSSYTVTFAVAAATVIIVHNLIGSRFGRAITAIRDNEIAAESVGINTAGYKLLAFAAAAFLAGIGGVLYGLNLSVIKPTAFDFNRSIEILVMVVLGGMGNLFGSVAAAVALTVLPELLRDFSDFRMLIYAVLLIVIMLAGNNERLKSLRRRVILSVYPFGREKKGGGNGTA